MAAVGYITNYSYKHIHSLERYFFYVKPSFFYGLTLLPPIIIADMKRFLFLLSALFLGFISVSPLFTQVNSIFTPFVSRIKADSTENSVKLSWMDTSDVEGICVLYRHTSEINPENLSLASKIAVVPQGVEFHEDFPPYTNTDYYYAVLMEDSDSVLHEVFIPFRNLTSSAVSITEKNKDNSPAMITAINAWHESDSIRITFKSSEPSSELFVYRNSEPIEGQEDIVAANLVATLPGDSSSFVDYPVPGIGYYYGIIDSNLIKSGIYTFKAGENTTAVPVEIPVDAAPRVGLPGISSSRPKPLPYLSISSGFQSGKQLSPSIIDSIPLKAEVPPETERIIGLITGKTAPLSEKVLEPVVLKEDITAQPGSDREMLAEIINSDFLNGDYGSARIKLLRFQKIKRSDEIEASINFYLGQIYYFLGENRKAFKEFLFAEDYFYLKCRPWIDSLFKRLRVNPS